MLDELLGYARAGYRVVLLADTAVEAHALFERHAALATDATSVRRTKGRQSVQFASGGHVRYETARSPEVLRGVVADLVCVPIEHARAHRVGAQAVTGTSSKPAAGLYVFSPDGALRSDDHGLQDTVHWLQDELGVTLDPWQRWLLGLVIAGRGA